MRRLRDELHYLLWFLFALFFHIPTTFINNLLWTYVRSEWNNPYGAR